MVTGYITYILISAAVLVMRKNWNCWGKKGNRGQNSKGSKMGPA